MKKKNLHPNPHRWPLKKCDVKLKSKHGGGVVEGYTTVRAPATGSRGAVDRTGGSMQAACNVCGGRQSPRGIAPQREKNIKK